jgi:seryl-tRNA synthetase
MTSKQPPSGDIAAQDAFREALIAHKLLIPSGVDGLYGRGMEFERVLEGFDRMVTVSAQKDGAQVLRFPPVISRRDFETSGFIKSFPQLAGSVFSFEGDHAGHMNMLEKIDKKEDWSASQKMTDVVVTPSACYPLYPTLKGKLPQGGGLYDLFSYCFRHEPSGDPARMQMFRMREFVRVGEPETVLSWRDVWVERGKKLLESVGLGAYSAPAADPFFGRGGKLLANNQIDQKLKYELLFPITSEEKPTAIMSFNSHQDHFGSLFGIQTSTGDVAHSACLGFGMERIVLALFKTHGFSPADWKDSVQKKLWPE